VHFLRIRKPLLWSFLLASAAVFIDGNILGDESMWYPGRIGQAIVLGAPLWGIFTADRRSHNAIGITVLLALAFLVVTRFWSPR
jgi:hypothetical protein